MDASQFESILQMLMSSDSVRAGEEQFNALKTQSPDQLAVLLLQTCRQSQHLPLRQLSAVLLKRQIVEASKDSAWEHLSPEARNGVKNELLQLLHNETHAYIRKRVSDAVSTLASRLVSDNQWPELFPALSILANNVENPGHRESALSIFATLAHYVIEVMAENLPQFKAIFVSCLEPSQDLRVGTAAFHAVCTVVNNLEEKSSQNAFADLLSPMFGVLQRAIGHSDVQYAEKNLEDLIELIEMNGGFVRPAVGGCTEFMISVVQNEEVEDSVRRLAMEACLSLAEQMPSAVKKVPNFVQRMVPLTMALIAQVDHDSDWDHTDPSEDSDGLDDISLSTVGEEAMDRLALAMRGKSMLPVLFAHLQEYLNDAGKWERRYAGLITLGQVAEGCAAAFEEAVLDQTVQWVLALGSADSHSRVRWAAIHCLAQLCSDFAPDFQELYIADVMPFLISRLGDPSPRVQSHSAAAIVNFVAECESEDLAEYMDSLLESLWTLLRSSSSRRYIQEQVLGTVAIVADAAGELFNKYYDVIMPTLKEILEKAGGKEERKLRGRAIDCISLIALAVGKEKFAGDAQLILQTFLQIQQATADIADDPQTHFLLQAWSRLCKCLGDDFVPYLSAVMPPLLQVAQVNPDMQITDASDDDNTGGDDDVQTFTINVKGVGEKRISLKTSVLDDKHNALCLLLSYMDELKDKFVEYVEPAAQILLPLLKYPYHEETRLTAAACMPHLLCCVRDARISRPDVVPETAVQALLTPVISELVEAVLIEPMENVLAVQLTALRECIEYIPENSMGETELQSFVETIQYVMEESLARRQQLQSETGDTDYNAEEDEEFLGQKMDEEEDVMLQIVDLIGELFKRQRGAFVPLFLKALWGTFAQLLQSPNAMDARIALCVADDLVENGRIAEISQDTYTGVLMACLQYATSTDASLRQAAVYGLGVCAQQCRNSSTASGAGSAQSAGAGNNSVEWSAERVEQVVQALQAAVSVKGAKKGTDNMAATCNAISSLLKVADLLQASDPRQGAIYGMCVDAMPVAGDEIEARVVHARLLHWLQTQHPSIATQERLPQVLRILVSILGSDLLDNEKHAATTVQMIQQLQGVVGQEKSQEIWNGLGKKQQKRFTKAMAKYSGQS